MVKNIRLIVSLVFVLLLGGCETGALQGVGLLTSSDVVSRPAADVQRDAGRKPFAVLAFLGVEPGMRVLDLVASGGYYSEVLAQVVGDEGLVYAQNPARALRFFGGRNDRAMNARLSNARLPNVRRLDREFNDLGLVANSIDVALTALNFHDLYNADPGAAQALLEATKAVLKPGGVLGIIDHSGNPNADNVKLHRIDPALVVAAAEQAGFVVEFSDLLSNAEDDRSQGPFSPGLRGNTDRFVLKLTKP
ncbi:MAG: class I SAM-dependent methyltransferase [Gammaproteobacteria bacterium]|nr:class I SAM-dependent methyltransferase [Gammaproteobacteria bacterium]